MSEQYRQQPPQCRIITERPYPSILERPLVHLSSLLLELLDDTLVDTSKLVDQMTSGSGLAGVNMSDDHNVQVCLFLTHLAFKGSDSVSK